VARFHQRSRHHRPAQRAAGFFLASTFSRLIGCRSPPGDGHLGQPAHAVHALALQELRKRRVLRIDEIAEHVHIAAFVHGRNLDAGDKAHADLARERGDLRTDATVSWSVTLIVVMPARQAMSTSSDGVQTPSDAVVCR